MRLCKTNLEAGRETTAESAAEQWTINVCSVRHFSYNQKTFDYKKLKKNYYKVLKTKLTETVVKRKTNAAEEEE